MADTCACRWSRPLVPGLHRAAVLALDYRTHAGLYAAIVAQIHAELCDACSTSGTTTDDQGRSVTCAHPDVHTDWDDEHPDRQVYDPALDPLEQDDLLSVLPEADHG